MSSSAMPAFVVGFAASALLWWRASSAEPLAMVRLSTGVDRQVVVRKDKIAAVLTCARVLSLGDQRYAPVSTVIVEGYDDPISVVHEVSELVGMMADAVLVKTREGDAAVSRRHVIQVRPSGYSDAETGEPSTFLDLSTGDRILVRESPASLLARMI